MTTNSTLQDKLREYFEGKEALYIEKGALLARVGNVRVTTRCDNPGSPSYELAQADIEEIPTPGLPARLPGYAHWDRPRPLRWSVGVNVTDRPYFSSNHWSGGPYVGWQICLWPELIAEVVELAAGFPEVETPPIQYWQVLSCLRKQQSADFRAVMLRIFRERMVASLRARLNAQ
jgi:hypothetical protein